MESLQIVLQKFQPDNPWGFRIQGGRDFNRPLVVSRITCESVADFRGLQCGDEIVRINNHAATNLTHCQAQELIIQAGNELRLDVVRSFSSHQPEHFSSELFLPAKSTATKNNIHVIPRNGYPTNVQMSHSNYDLKHRIPICNLCNQEIRGPFIIVLDYCFCPNHFRCQHCQRILTKEPFIEINGLFYCESDYAAFLAPKCFKCSEAIVGNETRAINCSWHQACFNCSRCGINLSENLFKIGDDGTPYCLNDWNDLFQVKCNRCNQAISVVDKFVEIEDNAFHAKCFSCSACKISLIGKAFHNRNGRPFCKIHAYAGSLY